MKISNYGINLIKILEGCRLNAYKDAGGVWTIGYGHTKGVKRGQRITQAQANEMLLKDLAISEKAVNAYGSIYHFNQNQFDALVSFTFNLGSGNLKNITDDGKRSLAQISARIPQYCIAKGKKLDGLVKRRKEEKALFDKPVSEPIKQQSTHQSSSSQEDYNMKTIQRGSQGKTVKIWQIIIGVSPDGDFGSKTEASTKAFQQAHNLSVDGIVGKNSWRAGLNSV